MPHRLVLLAALAAAASLGATAAGAAPSPAPTVRVSYTDLDLSRGTGVDALYARLRRAASQVCNPADTMDLRSQVSYRACAARALDEAVASVNDARLTSVHSRSRSG